MSTIIRKVVRDGSENYCTVSEEWTLRPQVEALEHWLKEHGSELDRSFEWIADIGFTHRENRIGGVPPLTCDLMRMCVDVNMEIYLSEYGLPCDNGGEV